MIRGAADAGSTDRTETSGDKEGCGEVKCCAGFQVVIKQWPAGMVT